MSVDLCVEGFEKGRILLPGLEINIDLPANSYFRNDGMVEDIDAHYIKVCAEFNAEPLEHKIKTTNSMVHQTFGKHLQFKFKQETGQSHKFSVIYQKDNGQIRNIFTLGHEAAHAAIFLDDETKTIEKQILADMEAKGVSINPFTKYQDKEDICNSLGLFAVYKQRGLAPVLGIKKTHLYEYNGVYQLKDYSTLVDDFRNSMVKLK